MRATCARASFLRVPALVVGIGVAWPTLSGCDRSKIEEPEPHLTTAKPSPVTTPTLSPALARAAPDRVVAIGDLHGDLDHTRRALRLAGAIDAHDRWAGGALVVVQTGDEIDRGDDDRAILDLVESLKSQAAAAGGQFVALLGNHEIMNAALDFRYVTAGGFAAFSPLAAGNDRGLGGDVSPSARGRAAAFTPGGSYAAMLARRPFMQKVGDTLFVHGGILPKHIVYGLDRMNDEIDRWLVGERTEPPSMVVAEDGPVWTRAYSSDDRDPDCADLAIVLSRLDARRMVVGHTVQHRGVNSACDGTVWRVDVGMSHYFGGPIEALEIRGDQVRVIREDAGAAP